MNREIISWVLVYENFNIYIHIDTRHIDNRYGIGIMAQTSKPKKKHINNNKT